MLLKDKEIPVSQFTFILITFMLGSTHIITTATKLVEQQAWLALLLALGEGLVTALIFLTIAKRFPGKNLVEINELLLGRYLGKFVTIIYLWFFIHIASLELRFIGDFTTLILPETPPLVFILSFIIMCASAVRNGIEVIGRCSIVILPLVFSEILLSFGLLIKDMNFDNFLPLFELPFSDLLVTGHIITTVSFGQGILFLMFLPALNEPKKVQRSLFAAFVLALLLLMLINVRNIAVLGGSIEILTYPSYQAVKLINIAEILTRLDILLVFAEILTTFIKVSLLYYIVVLGTAQLLKMDSYLPLVLPIGSIMISLSLLLLGFYLEYFKFTIHVFPLYSFPFELGIPLVLLLLALFKGKRQQKEE